MTPAVTKLFGFIALASVGLALFLPFTAIAMKESLSTRSCSLESLSKTDGDFCVDIRVLQKSLGAEVKLVPGVLGVKNPRFHCYLVHVVFISIKNYSKMFLGSPLPLSTIGMGTATLSPTSPAFKSIRDRLTILSACSS